MDKIEYWLRSYESLLDKGAEKVAELHLERAVKAYGIDAVYAKGREMKIW